MTKKPAVLTLTGAVAAGAAAFAYAAYRKDMRVVQRRLEIDRQVIDSPHGPIEFAESGTGPAVLVSHGAGGGFDQGLDLGSAFVGGDFRVIAPSRFGYLGTPLPADASVEAQAETHLRVLDALEIDSVPVVGVSAGAPSALHLCLEHPERCSALVMIVPMAYSPGKRPVHASFLFFELLNFITSSDFLFWTAMKLAHSTLLTTILGTPLEVYRGATAEDRRAVDDMMRSILPISRRFAGIMNDSVISSNVPRSPLEDIRVPALVISAEDDLYGTYESSLYTAGHIQDARFIGFSSGGHLLIGHVGEVRSQVADFLKAHLGVAA